VQTKFKLDLSRCQNEEETKSIDHNSIDIKIGPDSKQQFTDIDLQAPQTPSAVAKLTETMPRRQSPKPLVHIVRK